MRHHTGVQYLTDAVFDLRYELRIEMGCPQLPFKIVIFMDQFCTLRGERSLSDTFSLFAFRYRTAF